MIHNILIGDANRSLLAFHGSLLREAGYKVATAHEMSAVSVLLRSTAFSLVISELAFPEAGPSDAVSLVRRVATLRPGTPILVLTANTNPAAHREARGLGIWDISIKPTHCAELLSLTRNILDGAYPAKTGFLGHLMGLRRKGTEKGNTEHGQSLSEQSVSGPALSDRTLLGTCNLG
jgi:DNA-binding response OmpR family regulator